MGNRGLAQRPEYETTTEKTITAGESSKEKHINEHDEE
jgi:hypothetical protein